MAELHITLLSAALAALINLWLSIRCGRARVAGKVLYGDGGDERLLRAMRAHANFAEYTPIALLLVLVLELSGQAGHLLAWSALAFLVGRVLHGFGMMAEKSNPLRGIGILSTIVCYLLWAIWAGLVAFGKV